MKKKFKLLKYLKSNWVITLFSTMLGVIAGLYLTNYNEERKLKNAQEIAFNKVEREIKNNYTALIEYDSICKEAFYKASYVFSKLNKNIEIIISKDSTKVFTEQSGGMIKDLKFESLSNNNNLIKVRGEMDLSFDSKMAFIDLHDVIWKAYKQTNFINVTDFECLIAIEELYQFQDNYNQVNREWVNSLIDGNFLLSQIKLKEFLVSWKKLVSMNELLLKMYNITNNSIKDCN